MPRIAGMYEVGVPNACLASGVDYCGLYFSGASNLAVTPVLLTLTPPVNATQINAVAATSVTTINANLGATQALTFDANNFLKVDLVDIAGTAVSASTAQLGVNLVNIAGSAVATGTAQLGVNVVNIAGTAMLALRGTSASIGARFMRRPRPLA